MTSGVWLTQVGGWTVCHSPGQETRRRNGLRVHVRGEEMDHAFGFAHIEFKVP